MWQKKPEENQNQQNGGSCFFLHFANRKSAASSRTKIRIPGRLREMASPICVICRRLSRSMVMLVDRIRATTQGLTPDRKAFATSVRDRN